MLLGLTKNWKKRIWGKRRGRWVYINFWEYFGLLINEYFVPKKNHNPNGYIEKLGRCRSKFFNQFSSKQWLHSIKSKNFEY